MIFDIIMTTSVILLIAAAVARLVAVSGVFSSDSKVLKYLGSAELGEGFEPKRKKILWVFANALIFRLVLFLVGAVVLYTICGETEMSFQKLISSYNHWDSGHYLDIAQNGYKGKLENGRYVMLVFYPLYPMLVKLTSFLTGNFEIAGILVSWLSYAGACSALYALLSIDYDEETTENSIIYLSIFPFAFFFGAIMTESIFLLTVVLAMYFIRKHRWIEAGLWGCLASLSRVTGVMLVFAYFAEWIQSGTVGQMLRERDFKKLGRYILTAGLPVLLVPVGTLIYMWINYAVAGDALAFLEYEKTVWFQSMQFFGKSFTLMREYAGMMNRLPEPFTVWIAQIAAIILCLAVSFYGIKRHRMMYYGFLVPYLITNISASWPISGGRYMSCAFPIFIFLADFATRHKRAKPWIMVTFSMLFIVYLAAYFNNDIC